MPWGRSSNAAEDEQFLVHMHVEDALLGAATMNYGSSNNVSLYCLFSLLL